MANTIKPSNAKSPDLDWSQVRETVQMLHLAVGQIEIAMREGDDSINALTQNFTETISTVNDIVKALSDVNQLVDLGESGKSTMQANCERALDRVHGAIIAFQFYDKLTQRLTHVNHSLKLLADLVSDSSRLYNPWEWKSLQDEITSRYTMHEEHELFTMLSNGVPVEEALQHFREFLQSGNFTQDDIEFF